MSDEQAKMIFEQVICEHWPNWPRGAEELFVWLKALGRFDFQTAKDGINSCYREWDGKQYPRMNTILQAIRRQAQNKRRQTPLVKLYQIENEEGKQVWRPFWGKAGIARQELEPEAERLCKEADRMFPDQRHITRWFNDDGEGHGYYGPDAKDRAFAEIMAGPDTKAKCWLKKYLEGKEKSLQIKTPRTAAIAAKKAQESIAIGQVIEDSIPF